MGLKLGNNLGFFDLPQKPRFAFHGLIATVPTQR